MAGILQKTFQTDFLEWKYLEFDSKFLSRVLKSISQPWVKYRLGTDHTRSHHLNSWWPILLVPTYITQPWWVNTLRQWQDGRHFTDDIFKCIFLNENVWFPIKISLKFVPKCLFNKIPALVQIMAWHRPGDKPLSEPMLVIDHWCIYASLGLNELRDRTMNYLWPLLLGKSTHWPLGIMIVIIKW